MADIGKWCASHWMMLTAECVSFVLSYLGIWFWRQEGVVTADVGRDFLLVMAVAPFVCAPLALPILLYMKYSVEGKFFD